jgi:hypothetical protein
MRSLWLLAAAIGAAVLISVHASFGGVVIGDGSSDWPFSAVEAG